ncbi:2-hydroxyacyl-CoA dehydratase family protein [Alkaliphilus peptidifermentans]|nr:2-hydroxyacyl-CoA dehydratase family protein [Alkaliphilus peptidifermentans]
MKALVHRMDLSARLHKGLGSTYLSQYLEMQKKSLEKILAGGSYIASTFYMPSELFKLLDIEVIYIERLTGFTAANQLLTNIQFYRSLNNLPECGCSYQIAFDSLLSNKHIPWPSEIIALNYACDDGWIYGSYASAKYSVPFHFVEVNRDTQALAVDLKDLYNKLRSKYIEKNSIEKIVEISNSTMAVKEEIDALRLENPGIINSMDAFRIFTLYNDLGDLQTFDILNDLKNKIHEGLQSYQKPSGAKILWLGVIPLYHNRIITDLEERYVCRVVYEDLFDFTNRYLSVDGFFNDLASRIESSVFFSLQNRLDAIQRYNKTIEIDGIIHFSQRNCKFLPSMVPILRREMEKANIPFVEVSGDVIESQYFNIEGFWNVMDVFFEGIYGGRKLVY